MGFNSGKRESCQSLLNEYRDKDLPVHWEKINFSGVESRDVYNITAPFKGGEELVIAGRVEERDSEESKVVFFIEKDNTWFPDEDAPVFSLQDPFVTWIKGKLVFGGVEIYPHPEKDGELGWRTIFYCGDNIYNLQRFAQGPDGMKDIRLVELADGKIGVFTRPQGKIGGRGTIGFTKLESLQDLTKRTIIEARLLNNQFIPEEWGGVNEVHLLENGLLGVLGHIACFDIEGNRHYYPMVFPFNPEIEEAGNIEIIACRNELPNGPAKRPDLVDVLFSGGIQRIGDGKAVLYMGVSDVEAYRVIIPDPFLKYERTL